MPHPLLYEINTRCWLRELSARAGRTLTLAEVPESEFAAWRDFGFTHLWLMGIWQSGPRARARALENPNQRAAYSQALPDWREEDVAGSPYAIAAYRVPEALGGEAGLSEFRRRLNAKGMKLVLDFVPNHVGLDHPWLERRPELFVHTAPEAPGAFLQQTVQGPLWVAHGRDPNFPAWNDTAQLDCRSAATRTAMTDVLRDLSTRCDGVRCDMAMLLLDEVFAKTWSGFPVSGTAATGEFWEKAIEAVKESAPEFLLLAEAYWGLEPRLQALGFDYTYDKGLYDLLVARNVPELQRRLMDLPEPSLTKGAHFLENHDEPRIAALLNWPEHRAAALIVLALPGMRLLHEGQLSGAKIRSPVQLARRSHEPANAEVLAGYTALLQACRAGPPGKATTRILVPRPAWDGNPTGQDFILIQRRIMEASLELVAVNYALHPSQCFVPLELPASPARSWTVRDRLGQELYRRSDEDLRGHGFYLDLAAFGAHWFTFEPSE